MEAKPAVEAHRRRRAFECSSHARSRHPLRCKALDEAMSERKPRWSLGAPINHRRRSTGSAIREKIILANFRGSGVCVCRQTVRATVATTPRNEGNNTHDNARLMRR